ncbi:MAG: ricin-type beta-trefoil lectin domain protein [Pseudomonadota bacterium]|nr:ricin-type beta-trefoil lectin domain protein [Pseudomonadota bacterium]
MKYMKRSIGTLVIAFAASVSAQTSVEVKLIEAFEEDRGWCLDVRGAPHNAALIGGLRGETCHTYYSNVPTADQAFNMENIHDNNEFRMTGFSDKCITLYEPAAGSFVSLETCDGRAAQEMTFDDGGHIIAGVMPELCLTMSDVVVPGGGGRPLHLMRDVTFEACDTAIDDRQTWELRAQWTGPQEMTAERPFAANQNASPASGQ